MSNYNDKYKLYHAPRLEWEKDRLSCDVFEITDRALIDNTANIELILSQYLIENYGYSEDDGDLLAHLVLVYNAVFRLNNSHFDSIYTSEGVVSTVNLGIDLHYYNWAGKTFIYIPLSNNLEFGKLSTINSDILVDDEVIENIRVEDPDNIEVREEIIEFKEREYDELAEEIEDLKKQVDDKNDAEETVSNELVENTESSRIDDTEKVSDTDDNSSDRDITDEIAEKEVVLEKKDEKIVELRDNLAADKNSLIEETVKFSKDSIKYIINKTSGNRVYGVIYNLQKDGSFINKSKG